MKKLITKKEYFTIVGLMTLARRYYKQIEECENAYNELVDYKDEVCGGSGHFGDEIFGNGDVDKALKNEGIKIKRNNQHLLPKIHNG